MITHIFIVGGGVGSAPLALLAEENRRIRVTSLIGAKNSSELIFLERFRDVGSTHVITEDGSSGEKGLVTDLIKNYEILDSSHEVYRQAALCGPEKMLSASAKALEQHLGSGNIHISLERYMKCAEGLCGTCEIGGWRVCVDGPVFSYDVLKSVKDFGNFKRDRAGKRDYNL